MKQLFCLLLALLTGYVPEVFSQSPESSGELAFTNVTVISMESDRAIENQTVIVNEGRITQIGNTKKIEVPKSARVIDGTGKFLIPGLTEMHAHLPPVENEEQIKHVLALFALNGITTIRGMLGHPKHLQIRSQLAKGEIFGPTLYTTGPSLNGMSVTAPEQGAAMVRQQKQAGYDLLKLHPGLNRIEFDSIVSAAKSVGIPFAGHVSFGVGVWRAIDAGYSTIEHMDGFVEGLVPGIEKMAEQQTGVFGMLVADQVDEARIPDLVQALKSKNISIVPTQSLFEKWMNPDYKIDFATLPEAVYMDKKVIDAWTMQRTGVLSNPASSVENQKAFVSLRRKLLKACYDNGVTILLGCDAPQVFNVPGFSTHDELEFLVRAGMSPYDALRAGTVNVARHFGKSDEGVIRVGAVSNLILLSGNPLQDITKTKSISGVMLGRQWLSRATIDESLQKLKKQ